MTSWEIEFVESLVEKLEAGMLLNGTQANKLEQVYQERIEDAGVSTDDGD